ncbi:hypothetical protein IDJ77_17985 [Mucilaginibacter sp. ZT4R22]|uniref:Uncharacterized protein n=1 Tax=Mucilaginibacter pankratovii TaxID=2772110 RepID=A0ABR7WTR6_9SPHI|nr:hypothetical protein [Mucilaginibacter pankratovii]MBD1365711.1 hypothetical protein [Mucilaginibacter pankratovii]
MLPENLYKRRRAHDNTPPQLLLIVTNCIVLAVLISLFSTCDKINNFFWAAIALLALYNAYNIRRNREVYNRLNTIVYIISIVGMAVVFYYINKQPHNC